MHPNETIDKLSNILNGQIDNSENLDIIEMTKEIILDAEDSLRLINQEQEDAFFFQLIQTDEPLSELKKRKNNSIIEEIDSDDEINNASSLFNESPQFEQTQHNIVNDMQCDDESVNEG